MPAGPWRETGRETARERHRENVCVCVVERESRAEAEKAGQADHSLSDINPMVYFVLQDSLDTYLILQAAGERKTQR